MYKNSGGAGDISSSLSTANHSYNNTNGKAELIHQAQDSIMAMFSSGVGIAINVTAGIPSFIPSLPSSFKNQIQGLLGHYIGDKMDEFILGNALSNSISDQEIYAIFGQTCNSLVVSNILACTCICCLK